jgi:hypothetical protein
MTTQAPHYIVHKQEHKSRKSQNHVLEKAVVLLGALFLVVALNHWEQHDSISAGQNYTQHSINGYMMH